jgi:hypothetical protein
VGILTNEAGHVWENVISLDHVMHTDLNRFRHCLPVVNHDTIEFYENTCF